MDGASRTLRYSVPQPVHRAAVSELIIVGRGSAVVLAPFLVKEKVKMTTELLSMLGGGLAGFIFRFMAMSVENQQKT